MLMSVVMVMSVVHAMPENYAMPMVLTASRGHVVVCGLCFHMRPFMWNGILGLFYCWKTNGCLCGSGLSPVMLC